MSPQYRRIVAVAVTVLILLPGLAFADVEALFDLSSPATAPFPSDRFTVDDHDQKTGLRMSLPKPPDCVTRRSDCEDIAVINTLDGFNLQPRLSIPFSRAIDVSTVNSNTVFLIRLGHGHGHGGDPIGINQIVWEWRRQVRKFPNPANPNDPLFVLSTLPVVALGIFPGVGSVAFGSFESPDWETMPEGFIPPVGTRTGVPAVQRTNTLYFNLVIPAGTAPAGGWPVAIFGHGFTDSKQGAPLAVASTFARHGIATIAINVVGHGGGDAGTLIITRTSARR